MLDDGAKKAVISRHYNYQYSTVVDTIDKQAERNDGYSLPRIGWLKCYLDAEERLVLRYVRKFLKHTYVEVIKACKVIFKKDIVKRILKAHGIKNWKCKRRPFLT
jgi:hypothetical protein